MRGPATTSSAASPSMAPVDRCNDVKEPSELSTKFSNNVLTRPRRLRHVLRRVRGGRLAAPALEQAAQTAKTKGGHENATAADGPWMFTLDAPSYMAVRSHAKNRGHRSVPGCPGEASEHFAPFATTPTPRPSSPRTAPAITPSSSAFSPSARKASLLGYDTLGGVHGQEDGHPGRAESLLEDIRAKARPAAERELEEIRAFAANAGAPEATSAPRSGTSAGEVSERARAQGGGPSPLLPAGGHRWHVPRGRALRDQVEAADGGVEVAPGRSLLQ